MKYYIVIFCCIAVALAAYSNSYETAQTETQKQPYSVQYTIDSLHKYYPSNDYNSSRCNKPSFAAPCIQDTNNYYGYYHVIDRSSNSRPPIVALVYVSFNKQPWRADDKDQKVLAVLVLDSLFQGAGLSFINAQPSSHQMSSNEDYIVYFELESSAMVWNVEKGKITKYLIFPCPFSAEDYEANKDAIGKLMEQYRYKDH